MQDLVHARFVDDLLVGAAEVDDLELSSGSTPVVDGGFDQVGCCLLHVLGGWLTGFGANLRDCVLVVGSRAAINVSVISRCSSVGELLKHHSVSLAEAKVEPGKPIGDGGDKIGITFAESQLLEESVQRNVRLAIEGLVVH